MTIEEFKAGLQARREFLEKRGVFDTLVYGTGEKRKRKRDKHAFLYSAIPEVFVEIEIDLLIGEVIL